MSGESFLSPVFTSVAWQDEFERVSEYLRRPSSCSIAPGTVSGDNSAVMGRDGWHYIHQGSNQWLLQARGQLFLRSEVLKAWCALLASRDSWLKSRGARYAHIFVPEKIVVLPEHHLEGDEISPERPVVQITQNSPVEILYPVDALRKAQSSAPIWYRSNSHWNWHGAYVAASILWRHLGFVEGQVRPILRRALREHDLAVKWPNCVREIFHELDVRALLTFSNDAKIQGHVGRIRQWRNVDAPNSVRVLIFGDSYAYDHNFAAWFVQQCSEVVCVWYSGIEGNIVELVKPDIVVTQMAERYAAQIPVDRL